jgi:hypothetical protein
VLFWETNFSERMKKMRMLVKMKYRSPQNPIRVEFTDLLNEIDAAYMIRNMPAHDVWHKGRTPNTITPLFIKTSKGRIKTTKDRLKTTEEREFSPERLREEAVKISHLAKRFKEFSALHFGAEFLHTEENEGFD